MRPLRAKLFRTSRSFLDVITALEACSNGLQWYCVELYAGFFCSVDNNEVRPQVFRKICDEIEKSQDCVALAWEQVKLLAGNLRPEDMALLIAAKPEVPAPSWPLNISSPRFEITIQTAEDESLYVMTRNEGVVARLRESLSACELLPQAAGKTSRFGLER